MDMSRAIVLTGIVALDLQANCDVAGRQAVRDMMPVTAERQFEIADLIRKARAERSSSGQKIIIICE